MFEIECGGCQHDDGDMTGNTIKHCFFWGIAVREVTDQECTYAKCRSGSANYLRTREEKDKAREIIYNKA